MKKIHIGLLPRIIIAILLGIAVGHFFPASLVRIFVTFNGIFSEFLNFSIPLIILGLVTIAIADIGKGAGKMLIVTALIAYGATLFSGFLSYFTGATLFPSLIEPGRPLEEVSEAQGILPFFSVAIPPLMNVMTSLVLAFTLGLGLAALRSDALKKCGKRFPGDYCSHDQCCHSAFATALHLWYISQHDTLRTSILHPNGIHQNHWSYFRFAHFLIDFSILYCRTVCSTQSFQIIRTDATSLLYRIRNSIICCYHPCHLGADKKEWSIS